MGALDIGFLVVGNELLQGFTTDTNSTFLAGRLTLMGHRVRRTVLVEDDVDAIAGELKALVRSGMDIVFVCGGLGSTPDDVTMEAVAKALSRPLVRNRTAMAWIEEKLRRWGRRSGTGTGPTAAHIKMAMVPRGGKVLFNGPGVAPGVVLQVQSGSGRRRRKGTKGGTKRGAKGRTKVIVLPGVPRELMYLFSEQVEGKVIRPTKDRPYYRELVVDVRESAMDPMLKRLYKELPDVRIGSYPQDDRTVIIRVMGERSRVDETIRTIRKEVQALRETASL